ncbi:hypothetical protein P4O66_002906 [Electrophorus voltai]|uniref:BTB domain-containing protein n=1 Tax=Electrophorus voltai TaxID=2609070 RepID=A0AAD8YUH8_9TELE|nr:hypothetical protein P4O66_002906 [Electrophorus voltai]
MSTKGEAVCPPICAGAIHLQQGTGAAGHGQQVVPACQREELRSLCVLHGQLPPSSAGGSSACCSDPSDTSIRYLELSALCFCYRLQNPNHPTALLHKANQMRLAGTLCDVVIMVDSQEFHAHRTVLACTSKMFEILFHRSSQHYTLDFLSPKTFQQILEYAYTATLQAKVEDLDDLLYAAEILEIEYLEEQCLKILETIQSSDENDAEVGMNDGGLDEDEERKGRHSRGAKKHSAEEGSYASATQQALVLSGMVEQSPSVSASFSLSTMSPTKAAVDSLMSIGQSLLQSGVPHGVGGTEQPLQSNTHPVLSEVKTEMMQVDEGGGPESPHAAESGSLGNGAEADRGRDGPGTPTRSSVITSARELHYGREDGGGAEPQADISQMGLEGGASMTEKHLASLYSLPPNHKSEPMLAMPASMAPSLHVAPALAMSMDFGTYGSLLPQTFIQREFFSKLVEQHRVWLGCPIEVARTKGCVLEREGIPQSLEQESDWAYFTPHLYGRSDVRRMASEPQELPFTRVPSHARLPCHW